MLRTVFFMHLLLYSTHSAHTSTSCMTCTGVTGDDLEWAWWRRRIFKQGNRILCPQHPCKKNSSNLVACRREATHYKKNWTSYIKPEVHNVGPTAMSTEEDWATTAGNINRKFDEVWVCGSWNTCADRRTDRQTDIEARLSQCSTRSGVIVCLSVCPHVS